MQTLAWHSTSPHRDVGHSWWTETIAALCALQTAIPSLANLPKPSVDSPRLGSLRCACWALSGRPWCAASAISQ
eukprot:1377338-Amphidinium_carterae.2